jgi:rubredoxin
MKKYKCKVCGYVYDPEAGEPRRGIAPGTPFEDLKNNWTCPQCGAGLNRFIPK